MATSTTAQAAKAEEAEKKGSPSEGSMTKEELEVRNEIEAAREIQKQQLKAIRERKKTSGTVRLRTQLDPRKELVNLYVKDASMSPCFAPAEKKRLMVNRGYEPVLDQKGAYVNHDGDILFVRHKSIAEAELADADKMSKQRLASTDQDAAQANVTEKIEVGLDID